MCDNICDTGSTLNFRNHLSLIGIIFVYSLSLWPWMIWHCLVEGRMVQFRVGMCCFFFFKVCFRVSPNCISLKKLPPVSIIHVSFFFPPWNLETVTQEPGPLGWIFLNRPQANCFCFWFLNFWHPARFSPWLAAFQQAFLWLSLNFHVSQKLKAGFFADAACTSWSLYNPTAGVFAWPNVQ